MPETEVWYQAHDDNGDLWCETRDPADPYLLPSSPDQKLHYRKVTYTYTRHRSITGFTPSAELQAQGHPSTWEEDD